MLQTEPATGSAGSCTRAVLPCLGSFDLHLRVQMGFQGLPSCSPVTVGSGCTAGPQLSAGGRFEGVTRFPAVLSVSSSAP